MNACEERGAATELGETDRGAPQRLATHGRVRALASTALCIVFALWSVVWSIGWATGTTSASSYSIAGLLLLACAVWARQSALRNTSPRHL
ncbi:hypothetical protein GTY65_03440 [Streptomyces sp. SID8379]|uniref:hypothetical protein n=1 Tax=unclassified Streptomyces TaxID=2593676 RepID=UPI00035D49B1|nr:MULTISPECIES: hypothetical protein [unclassified Streptomyces]MYW63138.1 hypothetical protein [Streptomyces sp. SID8379]